MMVHQDASTHEWVPGKYWDLVVTMDDATAEHLSMFFCAQEGTASSMHGIGQSIARYGLFCSLYTNRRAHNFTMPVAQGKVDKANLTQVGRACKQLGIEHIAAQANACMEDLYRVQHNKEFARAAADPGSALVPYVAQAQLADVLCEQHGRVVANDCTVRFEGLVLQITEQQLRCSYSYSRSHVRVHRHVDATLTVWHHPRLLARFTAQGKSQAAVIAQAEQRLAV